MASSKRESLLLASYRALGLVSGPVPACVVYLTKAKLHAIICAVGNVVHTYRSRKLALWSVSAPLPENINCLAADQKYIFAGCGSKIYALHFGYQVARIYVPPAHLTNEVVLDDDDEIGDKSDIIFLLTFGSHLVSVDKKSRLVVFDIESNEVFNTVDFGADTFLVTALCHPATYLNKILLGSQQGSLKLFNIKTNKLVYEFKGWGSKVTCIEQSPAVDVAMIGLEDGRIFVHNLKLDETLMTFKQDWGQVCAIACRTDGPPIMISSSREGHLAVWDLDKRKLQTQLRSVHSQPINTLITLLNEPLLITSSGDNSLKMWIFDQADGQARLLHCRDGHSEPPNFIRFHNADGSYILSAGGDGKIKAFHTRKDHLHKNLGSAGKMRKAIAKKKSLHWEDVALPPCVYLSSNTSREDGWDNVVCCHKDHPLVTTWTSRRNRLGDHLLRHERFVKNATLARKLTATRCYVTQCGNFVIIGYSTGHVDVFNVQSGLHRGTFVDANADVSFAVGGKAACADKAHQAKITGVCGDYLSLNTYTACAAGFLKFWHFKTKRLLKSIKMASGIESMIIHHDNNLIAVALSDFSLLVVDPEFRRVVRFFDHAHSSAIADLTFNNTGHWIFTCSLDKTIKVWDLKSSSLIDVLLVNSPCLSLSFSPTGEYLATVHENLLGVYLWALKSLYSKAINVRPLPFDYVPDVGTCLPCTTGDQQRNDGQPGEPMEEGPEERQTDEYTSPEQLLTGLVTFSNLAAPRWAHLVDWDTIKERNKPKEPPQKPKHAPFFLPTVSGLDPKFQKDEQAKRAADSLVISGQRVGRQSDFASKLSQANGEADFLAVFQMLKSKNPSAIEVELVDLSPFYGGSWTLMASLLRMIEVKLKTDRDFELANSYLALFLKLHGTVFLGDDEQHSSRPKTKNSEEATSTENSNGLPGIDRLLDSVKESQRKSWTTLDELTSKALCLLNYVKSSLA